MYYFQEETLLYDFKNYTKYEFLNNIVLLLLIIDSHRERYLGGES